MEWQARNGLVTTGIDRQAWHRLVRHGVHWNGRDWQASIGTAGKVSAMKGRQGGDGMGLELSGGAGVAGTGIAATGPDWYGLAGMDRNARRGRARTGMARIGRHGVVAIGTARL